MLFTTCDRINNNKNSGYITYDITYPDIPEDSFVHSFLPKEMLVTFNENFLLMSTASGFGQFKLNFLCDREGQRLDHYVKIMNKKYLLRLKGKEIEKYLSKQVQFTSSNINETKEILGLSCKGIHIATTEDPTKSTNAFFSEEIPIIEPNWCTTLSGVKGVFLEYEYYMYDLRMHLTATQINYDGTISDKDFIIPKGYAKTTQFKLEKTLKEIMESFF